MRRTILSQILDPYLVIECRNKCLHPPQNELHYLRILFPSKSKQTQITFLIKFLTLGAAWFSLCLLWMTPYLVTECRNICLHPIWGKEPGLPLWQYWLWSFKLGRSKIVIFLNNQEQFQRKITYLLKCNVIRKYLIIPTEYYE